MDLVQHVLNDIGVLNNKAFRVNFIFNDVRMGGPVAVFDSKWDLQDLRLSHLGLKALPESFGFLRVKGSLFLEANMLSSLPRSFGHLRIGPVWT